MNDNTIAKWYDETSQFYNYFWYLNSDSFALHYGLWDNQTNNLHQALINTNRFMAKKADISFNTKVLDAGCGIGGSLIWLAKNLKAQVNGISISPKQIEKAKELSKRYNLDHLLHFKLMDYLHTNFATQTFDVVWAIESVCHAKNKKDFLKEAYRVLKKGGRIIIADGFLKRKPSSKKEKQTVFDFYKGMFLPNLNTFESFRNSMLEAGFKKIKQFDKTKEALPSSKRMYRIAKIFYPLLKILRVFRLIPEVFVNSCQAGIFQYEGVIRGLLGYGIFYGKK